MARNDPEHPEYARESQDLTVPRTPRSATESEFHYGRGMPPDSIPLPLPSCEDEISLESFPDSVPLQESVPASSASSIYLIKSHPTGGAANVGKPSANDIIQAKIENAKWDLTGRGEAPIDHEKLDYRGWADKGRDMIFGRKKK